MREKYCKTLHFNFVDFPVNFIKQFFPVSFGASNKCYYRNSSRIIVYIKPTKNIAYHNTEELIFYADKIMVMGNSKNLHVFNFMFYSIHVVVRTNSWCCEVVGGCKVRFPTSSQLGA